MKAYQVFTFSIQYTSSLVKGAAQSGYESKHELLPLSASVLRTIGHLYILINIEAQ